MKTFESKLTQYILALAIIVVGNLFVFETARTVFQEPEYDAYCPREINTKVYTTQSECQDVGGLWNNNISFDTTKPVTVENQSGWCDATFTCNKAYEEANSAYENKVFYIFFGIGIVLLVAGLLNTKDILSLKLGLSGAGFISLCISAFGYWSSIDGLARLLVVAVALGLLIWLSIKKMK